MKNDGEGMRMGRSGDRSGGGGRSGGFSGGGRSSGGFSGGGGHGRSGRSGGPRFGGFGGGFGVPRWHGPRPYGGGSFWPFMAGYGMGRGSGGSGRGSGGDSSGSGCGCASIIVAALAAVVLMALLGTVATRLTSCTSTAMSADISASTVDREALPASAVTTQLSQHYRDEDGGWIYSSGTIERGLDAFQDETGVQPFVWILPNGSETSTEALSQRADELYDEVFDDEAGFLLVFCDDGNGSFNCGYTVGSQAKTVMDDEAIGILADYLDRYYQDYSISEDEIFARAFEDTGARIMSRTTSPVVYVAVCAAVVIVAGLVYFGVKNYRASKEREAKRMEEVLNTPLETFGDQDLEDLEKKYQDPKD